MQRAPVFGAVFAYLLLAACAAIAKRRVETMLRITESASVRHTTIYLDGKLLNPWVQEVVAAVAAAQAQGTVKLNLAELRFADRTGIELLIEMRSKGVELMGASNFIEGLLNRVPGKTA